MALLSSVWHCAGCSLPNMRLHNIFFHRISPDVVWCCADYHMDLPKKCFGISVDDTKALPFTCTSMDGHSCDEDLAIWCSCCHSAVCPLCVFVWGHRNSEYCLQKGATWSHSLCNTSRLFSFRKCLESLPWGLCFVCCFLDLTLFHHCLWSNCQNVKLCRLPWSVTI